MLTVENIVHGAGHDVWSVNVEQEYHEEQPAPTAARPARHRAGRADHAGPPGPAPTDRESRYGHPDGGGAPTMSRTTTFVPPPPEMTAR